MARDAARALLDSLSAETVRVFTDGGCRGNPGPAGSGAVVVLPDGRRGEASRALGRATNNVGELTAIALALDLLEGAGVSESEPIALFTDSSYANGVLTRGWKAKANRDLILGLRERLTRWPNLTVYWVAGHVGIPENERADALANLGVDGVTRTEWR
ncbi:MAG: reverse transcriptase-like protein [Deltaproteobacteria bacterium]|nr:reverse transcriptase-like protein [Deltaproteobacteria bacterium]